MRIRPHSPYLLLPILLLFSLDFSSSAAPPEQQPLHEALQWVRATPRELVQYDYIMTVRLRLLFFWASKDDVGSGYIRRGVSPDDPREEFFQVLFGSDPDKAPRAINRWGAGTEVAWHKDPVSAQSREDVQASAFFGFMKSSRGKSVSEMQDELKKEKERGEHSFTGILSRVDSSRAISVIVPMQSDTDYNLHQYDLAEPIMFEKIGVSDRPVKNLVDPARCPGANGFLATVADMMNSVLNGAQGLLSRCYVHDAQENTLTLEKISTVDSLPVQLHGPKNVTLLDTAYRDLRQLDFVSVHKESGKKVYFTIFLGTQGTQRGVPLQIRYQPNWWFQVVLNIKPDANPHLTNTLAKQSASLHP
jgi:hypothetical protein